MCIRDRLEEVARAQDFGRTAAGNDGFDLAPRLWSTGHLVDYLTHRHRPDLDLEISGPNDVTAHADDAGAGIVRPSDAGILRAAHGDDMLHVAKRFDVIHNRRAHVETEHSRKIGRLDPRIGALAFKRFDQPGLLATDVGAGAAVDVNLDVKAEAEHVPAEEIVRARFFDRASENPGALRKLAADVN